MDKFVMLFQFFFSSFRTFRFSRGVHRIDNHRFPLFSGREKFVRICNSFFHKNTFSKRVKPTLNADLLRWFCDRNLDRFSYRLVLNSARIVPCFYYIGVNEIKLIKATLYVL